MSALEPACTPAFNDDPLGVEFDPKDLLARYKAGGDETAQKRGRPASRAISSAARCTDGRC